MSKILLAAACVLTLGCAATRPSRPTSTASHRIGCPFVRHRMGYCGPAALSVVFKYYGVDLSQHKIARSIYRRLIRGTLKEDMANYARSRGFEVTAGPGDLTAVKRYVDADTPVIAFITLGPRFLWRGHYVVIVGYDDAREVIICHSGFKAYEAVRYRRFKKRWRNNWIMVMKPPEK